MANKGTKALSRRSMIRSAGWAGPTVAVAFAAPAFASSEPPSSPGMVDGPGAIVEPAPSAPTLKKVGSWKASAYTRTTDYVYSNYNWIQTENQDSSPAGVFEMQHWATAGAPERLWWRLAIAVTHGTKGPMEVRIPLTSRQFDVTVTTPQGEVVETQTLLSQVNPGSVSYLNAARFNLHTGDYLVTVDGVKLSFTNDLPEPAMVNNGYELVFTWDDPIDPLSAGMISYTSTAAGGADSVTKGDPYANEATATFYEIVN